MEIINRLKNTPTGLIVLVANHTLGYYELKEIRYKFMPDSMQVAQIFPPRKEFVNLHENCFHLYQIKFDK